MPADVLSSVLHWLRIGCALVPQRPSPAAHLDGYRTSAREGGQYCHNDDCSVVGRGSDNGSNDSRRHALTSDLVCNSLM